MEHTDIAPLARRLAEENNVEWRRLRGSGERGRVVERDVLEYLARVMAGEEDLDPTPEPVPEGMQAWPDEDVRAFEQERRGETVPPAFGTSTVDDEIFLLDADEDDLADELDVGSGPSFGAADYGAGAHPAYARRDPSTDDDVELAPVEGVIDDLGDDDALLVAGDDQAQAAPPMVDVGTSEAAPAYPEPARESVFEADDVDAELLPDLFDDRPSEAAWDDGPVFGDDGLGAAEPSAPGPSLDIDTDDGAAGSGGAWGLSDEGPTVSDRDEDEYASDASDHHRAADAFDHDALDIHAADDDGEPSTAVVEHVAVDLFEDDGVGVVDQRAEAAPLAADAGVAAESPPEGTSLDGAEAEADSGVHESETEGLHAPSSSDPIPVAVPLVPSALDDDAGLHDGHGVVADRVGEGLPLVSHGAVFRRQVDLSNLVAAQGDIARDLELDEPVPLIAFLARAAAKGRGGGPDVGVAVFGDQAVRTVSVDVASRPFADVLAAIDDLAEAPDAHADDLDLIVADLADLDLDEAVLHLGAPVLAIGRVLIDTSTGGRRATLTLSGPGVGRDAAGILTRTAELLETPIRVVL